MAVVYEAWDRQQQRSVAIKLIKPELVSRALADRFERELAIAKKLVHPHVVPVYDSGIEGETLFFVMPLITEGTLKARIARYGPLPISEVRRIGEQLASALQYAHQHDCIHRDVKPENILISAGAVMLADFGIAKDAEAGSGSTTTGGFIGSPTYASPEQLLALGPVGPASDQYSLACVLFEALTGRAPFAAQGVADVVVQHTTEVAPDVAQFRRDVPPAMAAAIARALSKRPEDRFPSMLDFGEAFAASASVATTMLAGGQRRSAGRVVAALGSVAAVAAALYFGGVFGKRQQSDRTPGVAVLLCHNNSGPQLEHISRGATEQIIAQLSTLSELRVINMATMIRYEGTTKSLQQIGRELDVEMIVSCSAQLQADGARVNAELIDAESGTTIWSRSYETPTQDVLRLQNEAALSIAESMSSTLSAAGRRRLEALATQNDSAYALYMRGRANWNTSTREGLIRSLEYFQLAVEQDSMFAGAWVGVADAHLSFVGRWMAEGRPHYAAAERAIQKAFAAQPALGEALAARSRLRHRAYWDFKAAREDVIAAKRASPGAWQPYLDHAKLLSVQGRHDDAIAIARESLGRDPLNAINVLGLGEILYHARRFDEALVQTDRAIELEPTFAFNHLWRAMILIGMSRPEDAVLSARAASRLAGGHPGMLAILARAEAESGRPEEARRILQQMEAAPAQVYVAPTLVAVVHMGLGETDRAVAALTRAVEERDWFISELAVHPLADKVRDDPRVRALLERMGLGRVPRPGIVSASRGLVRDDSSRNAP